MHDGWEYVVASYGLAALILGVWFWMILAKLRRNPDRGPGAGALDG